SSVKVGGQCCQQFKAGAPHLPSLAEVVGFLLNRRLFSTPLTLEPLEAKFGSEHRRARGQEYFHLVAPKLPDYLAQFQEAFDIVLESLPEVDWTRCSNGDATVTMMAGPLVRDKMVYMPSTWQGTASANETATKMAGIQPGMALHCDMRTLFYPEGDFARAFPELLRDACEDLTGPDAQPRRFPAGSVVRYDAQAVHSASSPERKMRITYTERILE
ncbi:unnamed protein product, partial [Symbiodinium necroappetens]